MDLYDVILVIVFGSYYLFCAWLVIHAIKLIFSEGIGKEFRDEVRRLKRERDPNAPKPYPTSVKNIYHHSDSDSH